MESEGRMRVPLAKPSIDDSDIAAVVSVLQSSTLSLGPRAAEFEDAVARLVGARHAVAVNSGTSALHLALAAAGIGPGDEVVTTPFSFVASANCALYVGAHPVFADIDEETLCIDPREAAARVTSRTHAVLPVDVFGQPAEMEAINELARAHNLFVLEDACEAIGGARNGRLVGTLADATVFAFYPNKQITTGEGGMLVTDDADLARVARSMANQGRDDNGTWMNHVRLGYNYRLDEMSAALGLSQVSRLDEILSRRECVAAWYGERLARIERVQVPSIATATSRMSWFVYVARLYEDVDRAWVMTALERAGIPSRPYFVPIHLQPYYRVTFGYRLGDFPVTERVARCTLALPFFTDMTESEVDLVCDALARALARGSSRRALTADTLTV